jgi:hypothetical protein
MRCAPQYPDESFDVVFLFDVSARNSCQKEVRLILRESVPRVTSRRFDAAYGTAAREPALAPGDSFYSDWDGHYNNEPFYRSFRALDLQTIVTDAGFRTWSIFPACDPSWHALGSKRWRKETDRDLPVNDERTGRLTTGIRWFVFGAKK